MLCDIKEYSITRWDIRYKIYETNYVTKKFKLLEDGVFIVLYSTVPAFSHRLAHDFYRPMIWILDKGPFGTEGRLTLLGQKKLEQKHVNISLFVF